MSGFTLCFCSLSLFLMSFMVEYLNEVRITTESLGLPTTLLIFGRVSHLLTVPGTACQLDHRGDDEKHARASGMLCHVFLLS